MKTAWLALFVAFAVPAFAKTVDITCFPKNYECVAKRDGLNCAWRTIQAPNQQMVRLLNDPSYPNSNFPYEVWRGRYTALWDNHILTLNVTYTTQDMRNPLNVTAVLDARTIMAESSGQNQIDIALRGTNNFGRGFLCSNFRVID